MNFIKKFIRKVFELFSRNTPASWVDVVEAIDDKPVLDAAQIMRDRELAVRAHNEAFFIRFDKRIKDIQAKYEARGIKNFVMPIIQDDDGRLMWAPRSYRRKNKMA